MGKHLLLGGIIFVVLGFSSSQAPAGSACYQLGNTGSYLRLGATRHSGHTTSQERDFFGHPYQSSYAVHGKVASHLRDQTQRVAFNPQDVIVDLLHGSGMVAKGVGARLVVSGPEFGTLNCSTDDMRMAPSRWDCDTSGVQGRAAEFVTEPMLELTRVDPDAQFLCGYFTVTNPEETPEE